MVSQSTLYVCIWPESGYEIIVYTYAKYLGCRDLDQASLF